MAHAGTRAQRFFGSLVRLTQLCVRAVLLVVTVLRWHRCTSVAHTHSGVQSSTRWPTDSGVPRVPVRGFLARMSPIVRLQEVIKGVQSDFATLEFCDLQPNQVHEHPDVWLTHNPFIHSVPLTYATQMRVIVLNRLMSGSWPCRISWPNRSWTLSTRPMVLL